MTLLRVHHAQITVPVGAEPAARAFYCDLLGLLEVAKPASLAERGGFWLALGDVQIHVGTESEADRSHTKAHLAYEVDDLAYWRTRLREHGVTTLDGVPIPGYSRFEFRDPFGNRVELLERLSVEDA